IRRYIILGAATIPTADNAQRPRVAQEDHPTGDGHTHPGLLARGEIGEQGPQLRNGVGALERGDVGLDAGGEHLGALAFPYAELFRQVVTVAVVVGWTGRHPFTLLRTVRSPDRGRALALSGSRRPPPSSPRPPPRTPVRVGVSDRHWPRFGSGRPTARRQRAWWGR